MNWTIICVAIIAATIGIILTVKKLRKGGGTKTFSVKIPSLFDYSYPSPFGVMVYSTVALAEDKKADVLSAIERGITTQITTSSRHNPTWTNARCLEDYRVAFIAPDTTNRDGSPALLVQGKYQSAGTVLGVGGDGYHTPLIVLPHQQNQNWAYLDYLTDAARNESEHWAEWINDQAIFYRFANENDIHPHWD